MAPMLSYVQSILRQRTCIVPIMYLTCVYQTAQMNKLYAMLWGVISSAATFFSRSAKYTTILESTVLEEIPESIKMRLRQLCETRWVERHDAILTFVEFFNPLVTCLKSCLDLDKDTSTSAQLQNKIAKPEFIVATCVMNQVLAVTKPLSVHLQKTGIDVMKAMSLVDEIIACLDEMRSSDGSFAIVWKMAESLAETVETDLK